MKFPEWTKKLDIGYGFGSASGWAGLGITFRDKKNHQCLWFADDPQSNTEEEIIYNDFMRMNILESIGELEVETK